MARTASIVSASPGRLVVAVAQHAREAQRHAARIARARLHAVEGDLDDQLGPHVDDVAVAADLEREQPLGLPGEHLVGQALERLAEHHEAAGAGRARRGAGCSASPRRRPWPHSTASTTRSSVCARLDLEPARAAPAGLVGRVERLDHDALVAARQRVVEHRRRRLGVGGRSRAARAAPRARRRPSAAARSLAGAVEQVLAVEVQQVEERRRERQRVPQLRDVAAAAEARSPSSGTDAGRPSARSAIASPSSTTARTGSASAASTISGTRAVTSSSVRVNTPTSAPSRCTWMRAPSSLHSTPAGLTLAERGRDVGRRLGEHRLQRAARLQAQGVERRRRPRPARSRPPPRGRRAASARAGPRPRARRPPRRPPRPSRPPARPGAARPTAARPGTAARPRRPGRGRRPAGAGARPASPAPRARRCARTPRRPRPRPATARPPAAGASRSAAQPTPIWRWRSSPDSQATAAGTSSGRQTAQRVGQVLDLRAAPGRGGDRLRHPDQVAQQHALYPCGQTGVSTRPSVRP